MTRQKPTIGQTVYSLNIGNDARNCEQVLTAMEVTKVGRLYFTCKEVGRWWQLREYHLDEWKQKSDYCPVSCLYETREEYEQEKEQTQLTAKMRKIFDYYSKRLPLEVLRRMDACLPENKDV
jgi:hypothetical protein